MASPHPPEFRQRAIALARETAQPMAHVARDLGITAGCLRTWVAQADIDEGRRPGVTSDERANLVALRRARRVSEMDDEIRRKVAVYFARRDFVPQ